MGHEVSWELNEIYFDGIEWDNTQKVRLKMGYMPN